jgi:sulfur-carrier protein
VAIPTEGSADSTLGLMAVVRLFAAARDAAGTGRDELPGATVGDVLAAASSRYGAGFTDVLRTCKIWVNGEPADLQDSVGAADELAVLPPVSGGATGGGRW